MTIIIPIPALLAGILAALGYYAISANLIYGVTAPLIPLFILTLAGLCYGRIGITLSALICSILLLFLLPFQEALLILLMQIIPAALFIRGLMIALLQPNPPLLHWASLAHAITLLSLYGAVMLAIIIGMDSQLYQMIVNAMQANVRQSFTTLEPEMAASMEGMVTAMPHLLFALEFWIWIFLLIGITYLAQLVAESLKINRRPPLHLGSYTPPNWLLGLLVLATLAGMSDIPRITPAGQAAAIILMLSYFFSGLGFIHTRLRRLQGGLIWLSFFYLFSILTVWPLAIVTLLGLFRHIAFQFNSLPLR